MTIAISLKVNDGVILASDSATTLVGQVAGGAPAVINVYNNANKIFNLHKGLPIGAITWGSGSIGVLSISTVIKDLRRRFSGQDPANADWTLDADEYTVLDVAVRLRQFVYDELYREAFAQWPPNAKPVLGFVVAGFSPGSGLAEEYGIIIDNAGNCEPPRLLRPINETGVTWNGEIEALTRLVLGFSPRIIPLLQERFALSNEQMAQLLEQIKQQATIQFVQPAMPFQDAIDLAYYMVDMTIQAVKFSPGAPTVGGPIEVAAISKHEGFKWVKRKYYYQREINPRSDDEYAPMDEPG